MYFLGKNKWEIEVNGIKTKRNRNKETFLIFFKAKDSDFELNKK